MQPTDVSGLGRIEQRHRDTTGIQRAEERDQVLQVLRTEDGHPIAGLCHLLQACGDGAVAGAEVSPPQIMRDTVPFGGEVQETVGEFVTTDLGPPLDVLDQAGAFGEGDPSVLDERVMERHTTLLSGCPRGADGDSAIPVEPALIRPYLFLNVSPIGVPQPNRRAIRPQV